MTTRMHSSRMRTARSSSRRDGEGSASVHAGIDPHQVWAWRPLGCGRGDTPQPDPPQLPPWVWAWRPPWPDPLNFPLGCGPGDTPGQIPSTSPWVSAWRPPWPDPPELPPPGVGLETCKACWDSTPSPGDLLQGMLG